MSKHSKSAKTTKKVPYLKYFVLCAVILVFSIYSLVTLVNLYSQIGEKKGELSQINNKIAIQEIKNEDMNNLYNSSDEEFAEYIEQIAREDLDFIIPGERVFVNVSGD